MSEDVENDTGHTQAGPEWFGLFAEDSLIVERLIKSVQALIKRNGTTAEQIFHLAKLLHALRRLPLPTDGICIELSVGIRHENNERSSQDILLDSQEFRLSNHAYIIIDPKVGGDSEGRTIFEAQVGGFREAEEPHPMAVMDWLDNLDQRIEADETLDISDSEDSAGIDWDAETGEKYWEGLDSEYK